MIFLLSLSLNLYLLISSNFLKWNANLRFDTELLFQAFEDDKDEIARLAGVFSWELEEHIQDPEDEVNDNSLS